jgi:hypothetical protein
VIADPTHRDHGKILALWLERFVPTETRATLTIQDTRAPSDAKIDCITMNNTIGPMRRIGGSQSSFEQPVSHG